MEWVYNKISCWVLFIFLSVLTLVSTSSFTVFVEHLESCCIIHFPPLVAHLLFIPLCFCIWNELWGIGLHSKRWRRTFNIVFAYLLFFCYVIAYLNRGLVLWLIYLRIWLLYSQKIRSDYADVCIHRSK